MSRTAAGDHSRNGRQTARGRFPHRWRRFLGWILVAGLHTAILAPGAYAQDDDPDSGIEDTADDAAAAEELPPDAVPSDSTGASGGSVFGISPKYQTDYRLTRQRTDWTQALTFGRKIGAWDLRAATDFTFGNDSGREADDRDGSARATLVWRGVKRTPITLDFRMSRTRNTLPGVDSRDNRTDGSASAKYTKTVSGIKHTVDVRAGLSNRSNSSLSAFSSTTTQDRGLNGTVDWKGVWDPKEGLSVNAGAHQELATKQATVVNDTSRVEEGTSRRQTNVNMDVSYTPVHWLDSQVRFLERLGKETLPITQSGEGAIETRNSETRTLGLNLTMTPREGLDLKWSMGTDFTLSDLSIQTQRSTQGTAKNWKGGVVTTVLGTQVEGNVSWQSTFTQPRTNIGNERINKIVEAKFLRSLSDKLDATVNMDARLRQTFYDGSPEVIQDDDELRTKVDTGLTYTPGGKWTSRLSYVRETTDKLQINSTSASQTHTEENQAIRIEYTYSWSAKTTITQAYYIQATLTRFLYTPKSNRENQTQRIATTIETRALPHVRLQLTHNFNLTDSGTFTERGGAHTFSRAGRTNRQDVTARIEYTPVSWLVFHTQEQILRTDAINTSTKDKTVSRNLELRYGLNVQRTLSGGVQVRADGEYVRNTAQPSFLSLTSSLTKAF